MPRAPYNHKLYNRLNARLSLGWELVKTRQIFIDGRPYTLMICRKDSEEKNEKVFVEKGHLHTVEGNPTELGRVVNTVLKKQEERVSVMTDPRLFGSS